MLGAEVVVASERPASLPLGTPHPEHRPDTPCRLCPLHLHEHARYRVKDLHRLPLSLRLAIAQCISYAGEEAAVRLRALLGDIADRGRIDHYLQSFRAEPRWPQRRRESS